jgi:hypothetical protein
MARPTGSDLQEGGLSAISRLSFPADSANYGSSAANLIGERSQWAISALAATWRYVSLQLSTNCSRSPVRRSAVGMPFAFPTLHVGNCLTEQGAHHVCSHRRLC